MPAPGTADGAASTSLRIAHCNEPLVRIAIAQTFDQTCVEGSTFSRTQQDALCRTICGYGPTAVDLCSHAVACACNTVGDDSDARKRA